MTWVNLFEKKWFSTLFGAGLAIVLVFLGHSLSSKWDTAKKINDELNKRPTYEYVDNRDKELKEYVNKQDDAMKEYLKQYIEQSAKTNEMFVKYVQSIDSKLTNQFNYGRGQK